MTRHWSPRSLCRLFLYATRIEVELELKWVLFPSLVVCHDSSPGMFSGNAIETRSIERRNKAPALCSSSVTNSSHRNISDNIPDDGNRIFISMYIHAFLVFFYLFFVKKKKLIISSTDLITGHRVSLSLFCLVASSCNLRAWKFFFFFFSSVPFSSPTLHPSTTHTQNIRFFFFFFLSLEKKLRECLWRAIKNDPPLFSLFFLPPGVW